MGIAVRAGKENILFYPLHIAHFRISKKAFCESPWAMDYSLNQAVLIFSRRQLGVLSLELSIL